MTVFSSTPTTLAEPADGSDRLPVTVALPLDISTLTVSPSLTLESVDAGDSVSPPG